MTFRQVRYSLAAGVLGWGLLYFAWVGMKCMYYVDYKGYTLQPPSYEGVAHMEYGLTVGAEAVIPEYDITVVVSILHWYDDYEELNLDHVALAGDDEEVWGWSNCEWQPENNVSLCDVYSVRPEYLLSAEIETLGHEILHGAFGSFHEE